EEVDEAVAVRAEERQLGGAREELVGEALALRGAGLGEAGGEADEAAGTTRGERGGDAGHLAVGRGEERGIGCVRELGHRAEVALRAGRGARRVDAPELARVADLAAAAGPRP